MEYCGGITMLAAPSTRLTHNNTFLSSNYKLNHFLSYIIQPLSCSLLKMVVGPPEAECPKVINALVSLFLTAVIGQLIRCAVGVWAKCHKFIHLLDFNGIPIQKYG